MIEGKKMTNYNDPLLHLTNFNPLNQVDTKKGFIYRVQNRNTAHDGYFDVIVECIDVNSKDKSRVTWFQDLDVIDGETILDEWHISDTAHSHFIVELGPKENFPEYLL